MISAQEKRIDKCEERIADLDGRLDKVETKTGLLQLYSRLIRVVLETLVVELVF